MLQFVANNLIMLMTFTFFSAQHHGKSVPRNSKRRLMTISRLKGGPEKKLSRNTKRSLMMKVRMTSRGRKKFLMMISSLRVKSPASLPQPARMKLRVRMTTRRVKKIPMMISSLKSGQRNSP